MAAIILSGGKSKRIFADKPFLKIDQKAIIEREIEILSTIFARIIIVTNSPDKYRYLKLDLISDLIPGKGPLGGIYSGLTVSEDQHNFVLSCDLPFLNANLISYMKELTGQHDVIVPKRNGFLEPLHAIYSKDCLTSIKKHLDENDLRIQSFFSDANVKYIEKTELERFDPEGVAFFNVNTEEDLKRAKAMAKDMTDGRMK